MICSCKQYNTTRVIQVLPRIQVFRWRRRWMRANGQPCRDKMLWSVEAVMFWLLWWISHSFLQIPPGYKEPPNLKISCTERLDKVTMPFISEEGCINNFEKMIELYDLRVFGFNSITSIFHQYLASSVESTFWTTYRTTLMRQRIEVTFNSRISAAKKHWKSYVRKGWLGFSFWSN